MRKIFFTIMFMLCGITAFAATNQSAKSNKIKVVIDNDFSGDPDGLFQLAHQLLCSGTDVRGIIGGHLSASGFTHRDHSATLSCQKANALLNAMGLEGRYKVVTGAEDGLTSTIKPIENEGAKLIVAEAKQCTKENPLYVCCGASLTNIACAHLMDPTIDDKVVLVWIGGNDYKGLTDGMSSENPDVEFNLSLSIPAAQIIFNNSEIRIHQVPKGTYRQCMYGTDEIKAKVAPYGKAGAFLYQSILSLFDELKHFGMAMGETYVLGDGPLVLLTSLSPDSQARPESSYYKVVNAPHINDDGTYSDNPSGRPIRVYYQIDTRLMFGDFESKMQQLKNK